MSAVPNTQFIRKASLLLVEGDKALDLSQMHFRFQTAQEDAESPSNCAIRVFNLSEDTVKKIRGEYSRVVLQAGYENNAAFGMIFDGTIKQFRIGKDVDGINNYLDILAADGDIAYNFATVNAAIAAGSSAGERIALAVAAMTAKGVKGGTMIIPSTGGVLPRGKVLFGMAKAVIRSEVATIGSTWSIQNGEVQILPLTGYAPGEAVVLTALTGLIGRPEQTADGVRCRALMNPKIVVGGLIKIDNKSVNQTIQQNPDSAPVPFNQWTGIQQLATITADGIYRVYVAEYVGDTRGQEWYVDIIGLTVNPVTQQVKAYG